MKRDDEAVAERAGKIARAALAMPLERAVSLLKVAGEPTRLRLLALLSAGDLNVSDLTEVLGQSQPRISRHLKLLVEARLIERYQEGSWAYYRLAGNDAVALVRPVLERLDPEEEDLARDAERLAALRARHADTAAAYFARNATDWDKIRVLHAPEETVERAMREMVGETPVHSMLDLGTGTGRLLELFADLYTEALGIDSSREMLAIARARLVREGLTRARVRRGDILGTEVPRGRFDLVTMHQVLHFLDRPREAVREAVRALAPGGRLLIVDFAPHGHEFLRESQAHRRLGFPPDTVADWITDAGAAVERVETVPSDGPDGLTVVLWAARDPRLQLA